MNIRQLIPAQLGRRGVRVLAVAAVGLGAVGAAAGAAQADTGGWSVSWSQPYLISASYDLLNVAVADGSTSAGAPVIQWSYDGGNEQVWYFGADYLNGVYQGSVIENYNSHLCLSTDGTAGDQLTQQPCYYGDQDETFYINGSLGGYDSFQNVATGLYLDVSGYSWNEGDGIDLWYQNDQPNQTFFTTPW